MPFELRSIADVQKKGFAQAYKDKLVEAYTHDWVFVGYERIIVLVSVLFTVYSVGRFVWQLVG